MIYNDKKFRQFVEQTDFAHLFVGLTYIYTPFRLSKPQVWHIIAARSAVHIISPLASISSRVSVYIQEFMIMPVSAPTWSEALRRSAEVFHTLKSVLKENNIPVTGVGYEGGYAPMLEKDEDALAESASYLGMDAFYNLKKISKSGAKNELG